MNPWDNPFGYVLMPGAPTEWHYTEHWLGQPEAFFVLMLAGHVLSGIYQRAYGYPPGQRILLRVWCWAWHRPLTPLTPAQLAAPGYVREHARRARRNALKRPHLEPGGGAEVGPQYVVG